MRRDTAAIQAAFDAAAAAGGGDVVLSLDSSVSSSSSSSSATFLSRGVAFRSSHTRMVVPPSVTFLVSDDRASWANDTITAVVYCDGFDNVSISGGDGVVDGGVFDGQGLVWWQNRDDFRPHMVDAKHVDGLLIEGVTCVLRPPARPSPHGRGASGSRRPLQTPLPLHAPLQTPLPLHTPDAPPFARAVADASPCLRDDFSSMPGFSTRPTTASSCTPTTPSSAS